MSSGSVVCLHGIGADSRFFGPLTGAVSEFDFICLDLPGYGEEPSLASKFTELDFADLSAWLERKLDALGLHSVCLLGHSIGGMLAIDFAIQNPKRVGALVLVNTTSAFGGKDDTFRDAFLKARLAPLDEGMSMAELAEASVDRLMQHKEHQSLAKQMMSEVPEASFRQMLAVLTRFDRRQAFNSLSMPMLLIGGDKDQNAPAKTMNSMAKAAINAEIVILPSNHFTPLECAVETADVIRKFLKKL